MHPTILSPNFWIRIVFVLAISVGATASYLKISKSIGRLSAVPNYDDCRYMYAGMLLKHDLNHRGIGAMLRTAKELGVHSPISYLQAMMAYKFLGIQDAAVYRTNLLIMVAYVAVLAWLMRSVPLLPWIAATLIFVSLPIAKMAVVEFRPDIFWGICTCFGAFIIITGKQWLTTRRVPFLSGVAFSFAFLSKPSVFPMILVILFAAVGARILYTKWFDADSWGFLRRTLICLISPILILAGWYYIFFGSYIWNYFYINIFGAQADVWSFKANWTQQILYYITGNGGISNMGRIGLLVAACTTLLLFWRCRTGPWADRSRGLFLLGLGILIYFIILLCPAKQEFVGAGFYITTIFLCAWLLGQFYETYRNVLPARGVITCSLLLFAFAAIKYLNDWPPYSNRENQRHLYDRPTRALVNELRGLNPHPVNLLFMQPMPIIPEDIGLWMLRNSIRPNLLNGFGHVHLDQFREEKKRADLVVVPTPETPGIMAPLLVTPLLPAIIQDLKEDPEFSLLQVIPCGSRPGVYVFLRKAVP